MAIRVPPITSDCNVQDRFEANAYLVLTRILRTAFYVNIQYERQREREIICLRIINLIQMPLPNIFFELQIDKNLASSNVVGLIGIAIFFLPIYISR